MKDLFKGILKYEDMEPNYEEEEYQEITEAAPEPRREKLQVKIFDIKEEEHIADVLNKLREGKTIALINTSHLKDNSFLMKLAIRRIKKTCEAISGDIAGLSENLFVATPHFVKVARKQE